MRPTYSNQENIAATFFEFGDDFGRSIIALDSCGDPGVLNYLNGCRCQDCIYEYRKYQKHLRNLRKK